MSLTLPPAHAVNPAQLQDYVLDLLGEEERRLLEQHLDDCPLCRARLRRERELGVLVGAAVRQAVRIDPQRLRALRPQPARRLRLVHASRQMIMVGTLLLLFLGAVGVTRSGSAAWLLPDAATTAPTLAAQPTMTETFTPTASASPTAITQRLTPEPAGWPAAAAPAATPVVALAFTRP